MDVDESLCCEDRRFPARIVLSLSLLAIAAGDAGQAQVRHVDDLRCAAPGMTRILVDWDYFGGEEPVFLGDVDRDGFGDFIVNQQDLAGGILPYSILVYGSADPPAEAPIRGWRHTRFLYGSEGEGVSFGSFSPVGDLDADGSADFLLGAEYSSWNGVEDSGLAVLVFGRAGLPAEVSFNDLESGGLRSVRFVTEELDLGVGQAAALAGDLNGDGLQEVAISSIRAAGTENGVGPGGRVYVILGGFPLAGEVPLAQVGREVPGFVMHGAFGHEQGIHQNGDFFGASLTAAGDLNGDGFDDLVVGANRVTRVAPGQAGAVYVVFGRPRFEPEYRTISPGDFGAEILGDRPIGFLGDSVARAGDVDGDGLSDFVAGAPGPTSHGFQGEAYIVFGSRDWPESAAIGKVRSFRLAGTEPEFTARAPTTANGLLGTSVTGAGDWDSDGYPDVLFGAPRQFVRFERQVGAAYLVYGGRDLPAAARDEDVGTPALPGATILGREQYFGLGEWVNGGGDLDGDGRRDFILTAARLTDLPHKESSIYIFHGGRALADGAWLCSVAPAAGGVEGGYRATLHGRGFTGGEEVIFGGRKAPVVEVLSSAEISLIVPAAAAPGRVDVEVSGPGGSVRLEGGFEYVLGAYPDISLDPEDLGHGRHRVLEYLDRREADPDDDAVTAVGFGDLNGDGIEDLAAAVPWVGGFGSLGEVQILFGRRSFPARLEWSDPGFSQSRIEGAPGFRAIGISLAFPGDLDGDGLGELAVGAEENAFVILGRTRWEAVLAINEEVAEGRAFLLPGPCGIPPVGAGGELRGEWPPALILGSESGCMGPASSVSLYLQGFDDPALAQGPSAVIKGSNRMAGLDGTALAFGSSLGGAGDLNGDGQLDLVIGAKGRKSAGFLVLGAGWGSGEILLEDLYQQGQVVQVGKSAGDSVAWISAAAAGDFNGDGFSDAVLGFEDGVDRQRGEAYVVFGAEDLGAPLRDLDLSAPGPRRLRIEGEYSEDRTGTVSRLGDWNGDGLADVGLMGYDRINQSARAYVVLGTKEPVEDLRLRDLSGRDAFRIVGAKGAVFTGQRGGGLASGDLDGDGLLDLAVAEVTSDGRRAVAVIFGRRPGPARFVRGDANADGRVEITDAIVILTHLFLGGTRPRCLDAADVNDTGSLDITDAIYLLGHLFLGSKAPPAPYPGDGEDPTADAVPCSG